MQPSDTEQLVASIRDKHWYACIFDLPFFFTIKHFIEYKFSAYTLNTDIPFRMHVPLNLRWVIKSHLTALGVPLRRSGQLRVLLKDAAGGYMNSTYVPTQLFSLWQNKSDQFKTEYYAQK